MKQEQNNSVSGRFNHHVAEGWNIKKHTQSAYFPCNPAEIGFHLTIDQCNGKTIKGYEICKEMANKRVLNANVLDYWLANAEHIPENWKMDDDGNIRYIFFWGTIYLNPKDQEYVRCLYFDNERRRWLSLFYWLGCGWYSNDPAAVLK